MNKIIFTTNDHLRFQRSDAIPKIMAPTDLNIRTSVIPQLISGIVLLNVLATSVVVNESVKKSNASQVQPRKAICGESCLASLLHRWLSHISGRLTYQEEKPLLAVKKSQR
jgi:hypothetical protein